jgi:hypothetical protein
MYDDLPVFDEVFVMAVCIEVQVLSKENELCI